MRDHGSVSAPRSASTRPRGSASSGSRTCRAIPQSRGSSSGRSPAGAAEVDGQYSQRLNVWKDFQAFAIGLGRWLLGGDPRATVQASIERQGGQGIVRVELDPGRPRGRAQEVGAATSTIVPPDDRAGSTPQRLPLAWVGDDRPTCLSRDSGPALHVHRTVWSTWRTGLARL